MKILYVTTVGSTMGFFKNYFEDLIAHGHKVELASNEIVLDYGSDIKKMGLLCRHISCTRSVLNKGNITAIRQIREIVEEGNYDIVHCHTPIAAVCTRFACRKIRKERAASQRPLKVIYTAHGFHFFKGAPLLNWMLFYPAEKICARWTDCIITINKEDYRFAKRKFERPDRSETSKGCRVVYVPGVGIDVKKFSKSIDVSVKRLELGVPEDAYLLLSVGELNANKNQSAVISALKELDEKGDESAKRIYYLIAGDGSMKDALQNQIDASGLNDRVKLLGQRNDCVELYKSANLFVHPSFREGLPVVLIEALSSGLACIGSDIRGNKDLLPAENLFNPADSGSIAKAIMNPGSIYFDAEQYSHEQVNRLLNDAYGIKKDVTVHDIIRSAD